MNTACLGLNFLIGALRNTPGPGGSDDTAQTLQDIFGACETAVDILNDLLSFEKLESGILDLHTTHEPAIGFVAECVDMFSVQARAKGIDLHLVPHQSSPLVESDVVVLDKFKMHQVLRNLISNAIKFSPPGSEVRVVASFRPLLDRSPTVSRASSHMDRLSMSTRPKPPSLAVTPVVSSARIKRSLSPFGTVLAGLEGGVGMDVDASAGADAGVSADLGGLGGLGGLGRDIEKGEDLGPAVGSAVGSSNISRLTSFDAAAADAAADAPAVVASGPIRAPSPAPAVEVPVTPLGGGLGGDLESASEAVEHGMDSVSGVRGYLVVEVVDSGAGISAVNQARLFKEIVQVGGRRE